MDIYRDYPDPRPSCNAFRPADPRAVQPYLATLVNKGFYRVEYTGDITAFDDGVLEYSLVSLTDEPLLQDDDEDGGGGGGEAASSSEFAVVIDVKFLKAVNLAVYYGNTEVKAAARRNMIGLDAKPGAWYLDPVSKVKPINLNE